MHGRRPRPPVMEVPNKALSLALSPPSVRRSAGGESPEHSLKSPLSRPSRTTDDVEEGGDGGNQCDAFTLTGTRTVRLFLLVCMRTRSFVRCISCVSGIVCVRLIRICVACAGISRSAASRRIESITTTFPAFACIFNCRANKNKLSLIITRSAASRRNQSSCVCARVCMSIMRVAVCAGIARSAASRRIESTRRRLQRRRLQRRRLQSWGLRH